MSGASFRRGDFAPREPEFGVEFWDTNFLVLCFPIKRALSKIHPQEIHRREFTSKNHLRIRAEKFTLHFCRAFLLSTWRNLVVGMPRKFEDTIGLSRAPRCGSGPNCRRDTPIPPWQLEDRSVQTRFLCTNKSTRIGQNVSSSAKGQQ